MGLADLAWSSTVMLTAMLVFGYLLGSIPFGLLITRLAGMGDIRGIGSGNIGATNVLRTGSKGLAALTLLCDAGKGAAAVLIAGAYAGPEAAATAGLGSFLGHLFPVWLGFKGGKGVATYLGVLAAYAWPAALAFAGLWLAIAFMTRYSSLAALIAATATPAVLAAGSDWLGVGLFTLLTVLVFIRHHANLSRLMRGEETRIGQRKA